MNGGNIMKGFKTLLIAYLIGVLCVFALTHRINKLEKETEINENYERVALKYQS